MNHVYLKAKRSIALYYRAIRLRLDDQVFNAYYGFFHITYLFLYGFYICH